MDILILEQQIIQVMVLIFNEWHEGSEIEPSIEHGKLYLQITKSLAENFKGKKC